MLGSFAKEALQVCSCMVSVMLFIHEQMSVAEEGRQEEAHE